MGKVERKEGNKRGPLPGTHHSGTFKPGDKRINRKGPMHHRNMKFNEAMREKSVKAVEFIAGVIEDEEAPHSVRLDAAKYMVNQAYGTPVNRTVTADLSTGEGADLSALSLDQLKAQALQALSHTIEGECEEVPPQVSLNEE